MFQRFSIGLVACLLAVGSCLADSLKDLEQAYLSRYDEAIGKQKSQIEKLQASYLTALKREMGKVQSTGKLEAVIPFRDEIAFIEAEKDPLPALSETTVYQLKKMRSQFVDARQSILVTNATNLVGLADKMVEVLEDRERDLTKAGKIDEALAAKKMRESYAEDENIQASRSLLKFVGAGGKTEAALRIRRSGDHIEVLVRYDSKGKVSMDSPVENVSEETGGGGEKGDTKAKVLGEFVGAKGYEVDPWVAYDQVFDGREAPGATFTDVKAEPGFETQGQKGLRLSQMPKAKNPLGSFGDILPPTSFPGSYRIRSKYFVPSSNEVVTGFKFVQVEGASVGFRNLEKVGKWEEEEVTGSSTQNGSKLFLYFSRKEGKSAADIPPTDFVVIASILVEHIRFSASIQTRFGDRGVVTERINDPAKQPIMVMNGELKED